VVGNKLVTVVWRVGGKMSNGVFENDVPLAQAAVRPESSGRDWGEIGIGLVSAFALIAIFTAGVWAVVVLGQALI
jgi:hypothetical protein